jgi:hypothetical protein
MPHGFNARYVKEETAIGIRYTFFSGLSGAAVYVTDPIVAANEKSALVIAAQEAQNYFNRCEECGLWISDTEYNIDEGKCVRCAPVTTPAQKA